MRRKIAGLMHRFAYWVDCRADDLWNVDGYLKMTQQIMPKQDWEA